MVLKIESGVKTSVWVRGQVVTWQQPGVRRDLCLAAGEDILDIEPVTSARLENDPDPREVGAHFDFHIVDPDVTGLSVFDVQRVIGVDINVHQVPVRLRMFRGLGIEALRGRPARGVTWLCLGAAGNGDDGFCQIPLGSNYSLGNDVTLQ